MLRRTSPYAIPPESHLKPQEIFYVSTPHADAQLAAVDDIDTSAANVYDTPLGITNPPIDELLDRASSKYALVIYAAKRARQINDYYNQLGEGLGKIVPPQVTSVSRKPLSISLEEIEAGKIEAVPIVEEVEIDVEVEVVDVAAVDEAPAE